VNWSIIALADVVNLVEVTNRITNSEYDITPITSIFEGFDGLKDFFLAYNEITKKAIPLLAPAIVNELQSISLMNNPPMLQSIEVKTR